MSLTVVVLHPVDTYDRYIASTDSRDFTAGWSGFTRFLDLLAAGLSAQGGFYCSYILTNLLISCNVSWLLRLGDWFIFAFLRFWQKKREKQLYVSTMYGTDYVAVYAVAALVRMGSCSSHRL